MEAVIAIFALLALIIMGLPIGLALGMSATLGLLLLEGLDFTASSLATQPATTLSQNGMIVIPLFVMMGYLILHAGIAKDIFALCSKIIGKRIPGGLGVAAVLGCAIFAGISGSSAATVASVGRISYEEMLRHGYSKSLSSGLVSVAGTLGIMIPPSTFLVIYALLAEVSIQKMLFAGVVPGMMSALAYGTLVVLFAKFGKKDRGRLGVLDGQGEVDSGYTDSPSSGPSGFSSLFSVLLIFTIVMGGMYLGYFTATEASAVGVVSSALLLALIAFSRKFSMITAYRSAIVDTTVTSSMIALLLVGGGLFAYFLVVAGIPSWITTTVLNSPLPPEIIIIGLLILLIPMGMVVDGTSIMLIVTPLVVPILRQFGLDPIWFGILLVKMIEIGLVTPPLGINVFVLTGSVRDLKAGTAFRGAVPFLLADIAIVALLFAYPDIILWLPSQIE